MTGSATLTGRSSSAVGTTHDASKVTPCIVISLLAAKPPSPEVVHDKAPVPPGRVFLYDHIDPSWPRMFRIASCCQLPASRPAPCVHPRKGAVRHKNSSRDTEIDDGRLSDICGSCFLCLTLVNIVSTVSYWCTNVCHIYYNTVCVVGIMKINVAL